MARRHAPFNKKKNVAPCIADAPFFVYSNDPIRKIAWSKGNNSSELSNFDAIVKIKKNADCRQKEKKTGGDEEGRSRLMPKPNEILQQVYKMFHLP
jgi:hypothetical protein